jgi:tetratricopeptide (TPR) repeat protein
MRPGLNFPIKTSKILLLALFISLLGGCASTQEKATDTQELARNKFQEAIKFGSLGRNDDMIVSLKEAVKLAPEEPRYRLSLGRAYYLVGKFALAEKHLLETIELDPKDGLVHRQLGRIYMDQGKWQLAIDEFQQTLTSSGIVSVHQIRNMIALCYYNLDKFNEAIAEWKTAVQVRDNAAIRLNIALAYKDKESFSLAINSLEKAIALKPKFPQAHFEIALLYLKEKNLDEAKKHFKSVIIMEPNGKRASSSREYLSIINSGKMK